MKRTFLLCCVLGVALVGLQCTPGDSLSISVAEDSLAVSVTELDGGVSIENLSGVDGIVFVRSPEGEQRFELAVGEEVTVSDVTESVEIIGGYFVTLA